MCKFGAHSIRRWLGAHKVKHGSVDLWPQTGAVDQDEPLDALRVLFGEGEGDGAAEGVADEADALPVRAERVEKARQERGKSRDAVVHLRFAAVARARQIEGADAELLRKGGQVE